MKEGNYQQTCTQVWQEILESRGRLANEIARRMQMTLRHLHAGRRMEAVRSFLETPEVVRMVVVTTREPEEQHLAVIVGINVDATVTLQVHYPSGCRSMKAVPFSAVYRAGCWSWPSLLPSGGVEEREGPVSSVSGK